jgi:capsule biosynthesis phosphatase
MNEKTLVVDLDGTICTQEKSGEYHLAKPNQRVIDKINALWTGGWRVVVYTARGMNSFEGDTGEIERRYRQMTIDWLMTHRVNFSELVFGKPAGTMYVDDKGENVDSFLSKDYDS